MRLMLLAVAAALLCPPLQAEIFADAESVRPLLSGTPAPAFEAASADGSTFHFDPDNLERPAIITFYRGGWCPYCNLHWMELRAIEDDLRALGMDLLFLSADNQRVLADAMEDGEELEYYLLSDASSEIAQAFGIAFRVDDETYHRYVTKHEINLEAISGYDHHALPAPAVFIVDRDGTIVFQYVNPNYKVRISPEVLLAAARTMPGRVIKR